MQNFNIREQWSEQAKKLKSIDDIFNINLAGTENIQHLHESLIRTSFFLPREILTMPALKVSQLSILQQCDFHQLWLAKRQDNEQSCWHFDVARSLVLQARNAGVSCRWYQGQLFIVCKVWYGNMPENSNEAPGSRLNKLLNFCNLTLNS